MTSFRQSPAHSYSHYEDSFGRAATLARTLLSLAVLTAMSLLAAAQTASATGTA